MAEMESAEEFARRVAMLWNETSGDRPAARLIEADRAAIALAVLDELVAESGQGDAQCGEGNYSEATARLRRKYTAAEPAVETREG